LNYTFTISRPMLCLRAFSVAGRLVWNSLRDSLRDSDIDRNSFKRLFKTYLFTVYWLRNQRIKVSSTLRYSNERFTHLL